MSVKNILLITILFLIVAVAQASKLKAGSFRGKDSKGRRVQLFLKKAPEAKGSFYALLMRQKSSWLKSSAKEMALYRINRLKANTYEMIPLEVTEDGHIGVMDDNPSSVLMLSKGKRNRTNFKILRASSKNVRGGLKGTFMFEGKKSKSRWQGLYEGNYKKGRRKEALQISSFDKVERESNAVFSTRKVSGQFIIGEKLPGMFLLNKNEALATGVQKNKMPRAIGVFVKKCGWTRMFCKKQLYLINPNNNRDINKFRLHR